MHKSLLWFGFYFLVLTVYAIFSYALTDPNLVLSSWPSYWSFQQWMWQTFFRNPQLLTQSYIFLIILALLGWWQVVQTLPPQLTRKAVLLRCLLLCLPLFFSYNALSHDVFNYLFNAKMVLVYHADPHVHVALDYPDDLWTRFMHNTHTPAPYGYGWTVFSLLPYALGMNKFLLSWLIFRALNILAIPLLFVLLIKLGQVLKKDVSAKDLALVFLSPLFLIEIVSNSHNDLWMLIPAVASLWLVFQAKKRGAGKRVIFSAVFLAASISTKLATVTLSPIWFLGAWRASSAAFGLRWLPGTLRRWLDLGWALVQENFGFLASIALFLPLLTSRSQFFHPWYLIWSLIWLPLISVKWWRVALLAFVVSSLFRYVPWLLVGGFENQVLEQQQAVTWLGGLVGLGLGMVWQNYSARTNT